MQNYRNTDVICGLKYIDTEFKKYASKKRKLNSYGSFIYKAIHKKRIITLSTLGFLFSISSVILVTKILLESRFDNRLIVSMLTVLLFISLFFILTLSISLLFNIWVSLAIKTDKIDSLSKIDDNYKTSIDIRNNSCMESRIIFRERLMRTVVKKQASRKELISLLPLVAIFSLFVFYYFTRYDIENLSNNVSPIIGNASLFTLFLSLLKLVLASEPKDVSLYDEFISILNIAIETDRLK